ncbi:hypothetical protein M3Y95_00450600 [Aphelenchoides besseyi]|nr:hypothetical protein M3Y95_00450600 [Aphelenchoides besseyi]
MRFTDLLYSSDHKSMNGSSFERNMEVALTSISLTISVVNEVLTTLALVHIIRTKQKHHQNHTILRYNLIAGCFCSATGTFGSSICRILILNGVDVSDMIVYKLLNTFESLGPNLFRLSFISFMLERAIATHNVYDYEKDRRFCVIGPLLVVFSICFSMVMSFSYNLFHAPIVVLYTIYISLDVISLMCALILNAINQKLQVINARTDLRLSSRYQISENLRVLQFLRKLLLFGVFIALLCTASSLSIRALAVKNYKLLARISYFGLWNIYATIAAFLLIVDCSPNFVAGCCRRHKYIDYSTRTIVRNVYGKQILVEDTIDGHFSKLQEFWTNCSTKNAVRV